VHAAPLWRFGPAIDAAVANRHIQRSADFCEKCKNAGRQSFHCRLVLGHIGCHASVLLVERGQRNVTSHSILKLADVLGVDPGDLVRGL
jgi:hypothetical protein